MNYLYHLKQCVEADNEYFVNKMLIQKVSEYDQEMSQTADKHTA